MINLRLAITILLLAPIAYAITPDAPVEELLDAGVRAWGDWPVVLGVAVALLVRAAVTFRPAYYHRLTSRQKDVASFLIAGLPTLSIALLSGQDWRSALFATLTAWAATLASSRSLVVAFGKPTPEDQ